MAGILPEVLGEALDDGPEVAGVGVRGVVIVGGWLT